MRISRRNLLGAGIAAPSAWPAPASTPGARPARMGGAHECHAAALGLLPTTTTPTNLTNSEVDTVIAFLGEKKREGHFRALWRA